MGNVTAHTSYLLKYNHITWKQFNRVINYCLWPDWDLTINKRGWILWASEKIAEYYKNETRYVQHLRKELPGRISDAVNNYVRTYSYTDL